MRDDSPTPKLSAWIVVAMLAIIALPVGITLHTVHDPAIVCLSSSNPTPFGYSWSLLLFFIPILVIGGWFLPGEKVRIPKRAFWRTLCILVPIGFGLDFFFARQFFEFNNAGATVGIAAPAIGDGVPVEEYIFYCTGYLAVLLLISRMRIRNSVRGSRQLRNRQVALGTHRTRHARRSVA